MNDEDEYGYGDRAGEFLRIQRGQYDATLYVVVGFVVVVAAFWTPLYYAAVAILESRMPSLMTDPFERRPIIEEVGTGAAIVSVLIAVLIFKDRWRCIEATASRYCSGVMNLSVIYVPVVVAVYALARGAAKLSRR